jgi:hypothetical protein
VIENFATLTIWRVSITVLIVLIGRCSHCPALRWQSEARRCHRGKQHSGYIGRESWFYYSIQLISGLPRLGKRPSGLGELETQALTVCRVFLCVRRLQEWLSLSWQSILRHWVAQALVPCSFAMKPRGSLRPLLLRPSRAKPLTKPATLAKHGALVTTRWTPATPLTKPAKGFIQT